VFSGLILSGAFCPDLKTGFAGGERIKRRAGAAALGIDVPGRV
jgi:hypothetical protein